MGKPAGKRSGATGWYRIMALGLFAVAALASGWFLGVQSTSSRVVAGPAQPAAKASPAEAPLGPEPSADYSRRVVARLYGKIDVTREQLGEYLIARLGADRLENLVNKLIIEHACREKGIEVTPAEVDAAFKEDCKGLNVTPQLFVDQVLRQYKKTMYEWKEDVLKPRLLMGKLCQDRVQVSEDEIQKAFETKFGEKIEVRILLYPKDDRSIHQVYERIRNSDEEFERAARTQPNSQLAMSGGKVGPIARHSEDEIVEKKAFSLRPGELSDVIETPDGLLIMKCVKHLPPDRTAILENEHESLKKEVADKKLQKEIGAIFAELKKQADPVLYLEPDKSVAGLKRGVEKQLSEPLPGQQRIAK
jgi:parvulin-like peptidyl-prolyl isomerase